MADLNEINSSSMTKLVGSDATGAEQTPIQSTAQGGIHSNLRNNAGTEVGTTANPVVTQAGDGTDLQGVSANGEAKVVDGLRQGGVQGALASTTADVAVEAKVGVSRLANRKLLIITVLSPNVYYGFNSSVTTANGTPVANNQVLTFNIDPDSTFQIWLVSGSTNRAYRILESP